MTKQDIARVAHELNKAYCEAIGDNSQPKWEDAPDWQKNAAFAGVDFHLQNPLASQRRSHEEWLEQKKEQGWTWGPVKNAAAKEHPCFLPYDELPINEKAKDFLFVQVIHSLKIFLD